MMNTRERFQHILNFAHPDRLPVIEWATWWNLTIERWQQEGLPTGLDNLQIQEFFGLDPMVQCWFHPCSPQCPAAPSPGVGIIQTVDDYQRLREAGAFFPDIDLTTTAFAKNRSRHDRGEVTFWFTLEGFFWFPRTLLGIENHLLAFYDQPELLKMINRDQTNFCLRLLEKLLAEYQPEFMTFAEDMNYNHGAMISETQFDEFMLPYYREVVPILKEHKVKVLIDSDGDVTPCLNWFKRAGIEGVLPLERQAGVDINRLRREHPDFLFLGGFDKMIMHCGQDAIAAEFERLRPAAASGGFLPSCDHQTPPAVSIHDYRLYLQCFQDFAGSFA